MNDCLSPTESSPILAIVGIALAIAWGAVHDSTVKSRTLDACQNAAAQFTRTGSPSSASVEIQSERPQNRKTVSCTISTSSP